MKVTEKSKSSFQLKQINLKKSLFEITNAGEPLNEFGIEIGLEKKRYGKEGRQLECALTTTLLAENRDTFKFSVTMVGKFIIEGDVDFDADDFLSINAPSIIYPYIRQHVRTVSLEAGIDPIILPVLNFIELHNDNNDNTDNVSDE
jgi:preprotein translocase subunit SecB